VDYFRPADRKSFDDTEMPNSEKRNTRKKARISKLAQCIRKTSATASVKRKYMPDASTYEADHFTPSMSAKFMTLIEKIKDLDTADMKAHGTKFKHFVFTDIRESAYGAKALASFMIAAGFDLRMGKDVAQIKRDGVMVQTKKGAVKFLEKDPVPGGSNNFALLQSLPLWNNPLSVGTKKAILSTYNKRPDNINGELLRIVVLDSKYKEGIDLFDVKYVHLLEPPIASSDLKQAVGRATRFCGQKGLHFVPKQGWPLQVYIYHTELPNRAPFVLGDGQKVDAHELMLAKSGLDLALLNLTKELTVLSITTAVDYDLNYKINNFDIESALLEATDTVIAEVAATTGGARRLVGIHSVDDITPQLLKRCEKRQSRLFPFSKERMRTVARSLGIPAPQRAKRAYYCAKLTEHPEYLQSLLASHNSINKRSLEGIHGSPRRISATPNQNEENAYRQMRELFRTPTAPSRSRKELDELAKLPFHDFQKGILNLYKTNRWSAPIIQSGCDSIQAGKDGSSVTFTQTQDFVRHYLTPESPFKGLLAWHSVGTGKTCMAVAAATTHFEQAGYTILWVTRNALMADVYKNIFGAVCSIPIIEKLKTTELPKTLSEQKRWLSRAWLPPISYRTFQNALQGKNELGRMLKAKHADPLHKTFLVMDEIHKLQDGDLSAAESADFSVIQQFLQDSYAQSGADSVRPLFMTATPITDTPNELFTILNALIPSASKRLMPFDEFRKKYTDEHGFISAEGRLYFQEKAKGLISYLNRELDPTTFAQPVFHTVRVPIGEAVLPTLEALVDRCMSNVEANAPEEDDCAALETMMLKDITAVGKGKGSATRIADIKRTYKKRIRDCKATRKARAAAVKVVLKATRSCYTQEKQKYKAAFDDSQRVALESCFTDKAPKTDFYAKSDFDAEVARRLGAKPDSRRSSTGAVRTPLE
jgi:Type III restriction enzyme, res subunit